MLTVSMNKIRPFATLNSWDDLVRAEEKISSGTVEWVFRGESEQRVPTTTLHRAWERFSGQFKGFPGTTAVCRLEMELYSEFQRNYPIYSANSVPKREDTIHWLSLMRHYGVPTRFLDFTFSMFIATFFALESPSKILVPKSVIVRYKPAAVWAINKSWLTQHSVRQMKRLGGLQLCEQWSHREGRAFERIFWKKKPALKTVFTLNPFGSHERLHVQQGLFLCPGDIRFSFDDNLISLAGWKSAVRLYLIGADCRDEILWKLRQCGTSRESLFPGLQGFAESLGIATPLLLLRRMKSERDKNRVPTDALGDLKFSKYRP